MLSVPTNVRERTARTQTDAPIHTWGVTVLYPDGFHRMPLLLQRRPGSAHAPPSEAPSHTHTDGETERASERDRNTGGGPESTPPRLPGLQ
jgi:hypothetical protein